METEKSSKQEQSKMNENMSVRDLQASPVRTKEDFQVHQSIMGAEMILRNTITPEPYYGMTSVRDWLKTYELVSDNNGWSEVKRLANLPLAMKGTAADWLEGSYPNGMAEESWDHVRKALLEAFQQFNEPQFYRSKIRTATQAPGEPINSFYWRLHALYRKSGQHFNDEDFKFDFLRGMIQPLRIRMETMVNKRPEEMLERAKMLEEAMAQHPREFKTSTLTAAVTYDTESPDPQLMMMEAVQKQLQSLITVVTQQAETTATLIKAARPDNMPPFKRKEIRSCFKCGEVGHIARFCRTKKEKPPAPPGTKPDDSKKESLN